MFGNEIDAEREKASISLRQLNQGETWTDALGRTQEIHEMSTKHLVNVQNYLHRNAARFELADSWNNILRSPDPYFEDDLVDEFAQRDPMVWLKGTVLYKTICSELYSRLYEPVIEGAPMFVDDGRDLEIRAKAMVDKAIKDAVAARPAFARFGFGTPRPDDDLFSRVFGKPR
jgi:hypothetical protein